MSVPTPKPNGEGAVPSIAQSAASEPSTVGNNAQEPIAGPSRPPRPPLSPSVAKLFKADIQEIKQELHDALGDSGLAYWRTLNGYLLGQVGRGELEGLVRGWLKGSKIQLHNRLLLSLLSHAGLPQSGQSSTKKRKRVGPDDPEYDMNENIIEPKARVHHWMMGIVGRERARMKRAVIGRPGQDDDAAGEEDTTLRKRSWGVQPGTTMPPLASPARQLPASHQLSHRLSQLAKAYDLNLSSDGMAAIGEFLAIGLDAHLSDILHSYMHLVTRDRNSSESLRVPPGLNGHISDMDIDIKEEHDDDGIPKPDLDKLRDLLTLNPTLHPTTSPALFKLGSSLFQAEAEYNSPPVKVERKPSLSPEIEIPIHAAAGGGSTERGSEGAFKKLIAEGLVKIDNVKKGEEGEGGGKKDKKHNLHWRYEDPAIILKDVFG